VLPATRQRWHSRLYFSRSWYSIKRPRSDARLSLPSSLVTYRDGIPAQRRSPIPVLTGPDVRRTPLTTMLRRQAIICWVGTPDPSTPRERTLFMAMRPRIKLLCPLVQCMCVCVCVCVWTVSQTLDDFRQRLSMSNDEITPLEHAITAIETGDSRAMTSA